MGMQDPKPTFTYFVSEIKKRYPGLLYIHLIEPRISGNTDAEDPWHGLASNEFLRDIWLPKPLIVAGGFNKESAIEAAEKEGQLIAFGRYYTSNVWTPLFVVLSSSKPS
jgi:NADPH2 dehydrogenase